VWKGKELRDILKDMQQMFEDVLTKAKGSEQDLSCVIVRHPELNHPIVVPLDKWSNINTNTVMTAVENVLNSDQKFSVRSNGGPYWQHFRAKGKWSGTL
jgi:hypothetical protein